MAKYDTRPMEEKYNLSPSILENIKDDFESGEYTMQETADLWSLEYKLIERLRIKHNWLTKTKRLAFKKELTENPKLLKKLSNPNNKCHQELSPAELLVIKKAKRAVAWEDGILDVSMKALEELKPPDAKEKSLVDLANETRLMEADSGGDYLHE